MGDKVKKGWQGSFDEGGMGWIEQDWDEAGRAGRNSACCLAELRIKDLSVYVGKKDLLEHRYSACTAGDEVPYV